MTSQLTLSTLQAAAARYDEAAAKVLSAWEWVCECSSPGQSLACLDCTGFKLFIELVQKQSCSEAPGEFPHILPARQLPPYSATLKQDCILLFQKGYTTEQIQYFTGMGNQTVLLSWLREAKLMGSTTRDYEHQKQRCIELSLKGLLPVQVQVETGVPADVVSRWLRDVNIQQKRRQFSQEDKQHCLALYLSGKSLLTVAKEMDIPRSTVESWVRRSGAQRARVKGGGRPPIYAKMFKLECVALVREGKSCVEVSEIKGCSETAVREWWQKFKDVPVDQV
ncbi:MAG: transposase [Stenomitos rutilans HA7619-LM2]|nr:transposase [Stenomitos rutilans HA7619-LM2]